MTSGNTGGLGQNDYKYINRKSMSSKDAEQEPPKQESPGYFNESRSEDASTGKELASDS